jgi:hypothetical protein
MVIDPTVANAMRQAICQVFAAHTERPWEKQLPGATLIGQTVFCEVTIRQ